MTTLEDLKWDAAGLVTVVVQDRHTGEIRMLAHASRDAVERTLESGDAWFFSRSRSALWRKGETSGNVIRVFEVWADCDGDALVYLADPAGPSCHTERATCFFRRVRADGVEAVSNDHAAPTFLRLTHTLDARMSAEAEKSYTKSLFEKGAPKIGEKLEEEAHELADAVASEATERVVSEAADVLYHAMVGLRFRDTDLRAVAEELARRFGVSGHDEKASRR